MEMTTSVIDRLCALHDIKKPEKFFQALGNKNIILGDKDIDEILDNSTGKKSGWRKLVPFLGNDKKPKVSNNTDDEATDLFLVDKDFNRKKPFIIKDTNITRLIFPPCCRPIPGDDILGYIDNRNHIEIHKRSCDVATKLKSSFGNHIIDAKWDMHRRILFDATIQITGIDRIGLLNELTHVISSQLNLNMQKLVISTTDGIFDGTIQLKVYERKDVKIIMDSLKAIEGLEEIKQIQ